jgi:hypothetical protein
METQGWRSTTWEVDSCSVMNAEHMLRQRIGVLSGGGADERIAVILREGQS